MKRPRAPEDVRNIANFESANIVASEIVHTDAARFQPATEILVENDVGAPEAIDRLFRITHHEELARAGTNVMPVGVSGIVRGEQHKNLGLDRIRILKFVDEYVGEA